MFYRISNSSGSNIGQEYPQIQDCGGSMLDSPERSIYKFPLNELPYLGPNLDFLKMTSRSKLTDCISASHISKGFLISSRFKKILKKYNLPQHKFYPVKILHKNELLDYWWFTYIGNLEEYIDYSKTIFYTIDSYFIKEELPNINREELIKLWSSSLLEMKSFRSSKINFIKKYQLNMDLFVLASFDQRTYVSGRLKLELEASNISGLEFNTAYNF